MYPALIPRGTAHVHTVNSAAGQCDWYTALDGTLMSSFLLDFFARSTGSSHIFNDIVRSLPSPRGKKQKSLNSAALQYLRLNCMTSAYANLWEDLADETWTPDIPIRNAKERFHAQNEIDASVALSLGVDVEELCLIYRTQFPVMRRYDREGLYDAAGRKVAKDVVRLQGKLKDGEELSVQERTWTHPQSEVTCVFEYPFQILDREADLRRAYRALATELRE